MNELSTMEDAHVSISVGAVIRSLIDPFVDGNILGEKHRSATEVVLASVFLPMLAREDRIAAYLDLPLRSVRQMGWRLRCAGIWVGTGMAADCYAELMEDSEKANLTLALFASVAVGSIWGQRRDNDGVLVYSAFRPPAPVHIDDGRLCSKCWTTKKYGQTGKCVECQRRYMRRYMGNGACVGCRPLPL